MIQGLLILTPFTADDDLRTISSKTTPFLKIKSITISSDDDNNDSRDGIIYYNIKPNYSIYNHIESTIAINYLYTGMTLSYDISITDVDVDINESQIIQKTYNKIIDYFNNNSIKYAIIGNNISLGKWYAFSGITVTYSSLYANTIIKNSGGTTIINTDPELTSNNNSRGSFTLTKNDIYSSNKPIHLICENYQMLISPLSLNGYFYNFYSHRNSPNTVYIYSNYDTNIYYYKGSGNTNTSGIKTDPIQYLTIKSGQTSILTYKDILEYYYIKSDKPISTTISQYGVDKEILCPSSKYCYYRLSGFPTNIYGKKLNHSNNVVYDNIICMNTNVADGAGADMEHGVGIEYISNSYLFGNTVSDFAIVMPYSSTTVDVYYLDYTNKCWKLLENFYGNGTLTNPIYYFRDGNNGTGVTGNVYSGGANNFINNNTKLWKFMGNYPFALIMNDSTDDEFINYGWNQNNENKIVEDGLLLHLDSDNLNSYNDSNSPKRWYSLIPSYTGQIEYGKFYKSTGYDGVTWKNGTFDFDGYGYIYFNNTYSSLNSYTFEYFAYIDTDTDTYKNIVFGFGGSSHNFYKYSDYSWKYTHGGTSDEYYYPKTVTINKWGHWVITYDGSNVKIYRNSHYEGSKSSTGSADFSSIKLIIGDWVNANTTSSNRCWKDPFSVFRFYNRALSQTEITQNFNAQRHRFNI